MTNAAQELAPSDKRTRVRKSKWEVAVMYQDGTLKGRPFTNWSTLSGYLQAALEDTAVDSVSVGVIKNDE